MEMAVRYFPMACLPPILLYPADIAQLDILQMVNLGYFNALNIWLFAYLEYFFMA